MTVPQAVRAIVAATPGEPITMTLYDGTGALAEISLGPADAVALAGDLIERARSGYGRDTSDTRAIDEIWKGVGHAERA